VTIPLSPLFTMNSGNGVFPKMENRPKITGFTFSELVEWAASVELKPYRAKQIYQWLYAHKVSSFDEMTNISKKIRQKISETFTLNLIPVIDKKSSPDGTIKILQELWDGHNIESVLLKHDDHYTVCISTQVGCAMACKFCLTAKMGFVRNLEAGEIVEQVLNLNALLSEGESIRNIVYMGMGEPFLNYENTMKSLEIFQNENGFNFSSRRITVSTSGIVPGIRRFGTEKIKANLAISLNGVNQEAREKLMPVSKRYSLDELMQACRSFPREARQRITFEYVLMDGITDSLKSAKALVSLLHGTKSKVNLIPYNESPDLEFKASDKKSIEQFKQYLMDHGIVATLRTSKGQGISAACGQLAVKKVK